jgi:DNA-binding NarL/FixJ family response regulator
LVVGLAGPDGDRLERAFSRGRAEVERAKTLPEFRSRLAHVELDPPLVVYIDLTLLEGEPDEILFELQQALPPASWVGLAPSLESERAAHLLGLGLPSLSLPRDFGVLVQLAGRLSMLAPRAGATGSGVGELARAVRAYAVARCLSEKQRAILRLYLDGANDKAIAAACGCSVPTVYEHWRRMAKKAGAAHKGDAIADFHRFLGEGTVLSGFRGRQSESA